MNTVVKREIEAQVVDRLGHVFERHEKRPREVLTSGVSEIDQALGGFPRGEISEIHGSVSCGRASLMLATLAAATSSGETCALIDCSDTFDLLSATKAGVSFDRLLWVRCNNNLERAFKAADLLLHGGGFGLLALHLADMPARSLRRIISSWWFRFRRAIEDTPTVLLVMTPIACVRSCAAMVLELKNEGPAWMGGGALAEEAPGLSRVISRGRPPLHLSLVTHPLSSSTVSHSHLLQATNIRVNRERPLMASHGRICFTPRFCGFA